MEHIIPNCEESYISYISRILFSRENKKYDTEYMERHHITPKSLGGDNSEENLIWLFASEHYYAHKLLAKENGSIKELQYAWWNMAHCDGRGGKREFQISAEEYQEARAAFVKNIKGENNPVYGNSGDKGYFYGKTHTEEARKKISEARKKHKKEKKVPSIIFSEKTKQLMSQNHYDCSGANNPRAKKVKCIETGEIFSTAKEAGEKYKLTPSNPGCTIRRACKTGNTSGFDKDLNLPLHWTFIND